ncbi:glycosyltransferase family 2 protein [uncultured Polaribacter sp.]|uniref:glycosyltransferase family 2 protein n=1 Tax=uncultured Polaribacter sp. TaxID=174711 RepID=UPI002631935C|nr:glycosyltransferase family 2 protein [uncultured Polaribacter sp.]
MRIGKNPEKDLYKEIIYKPHRIIIPVYIPNSNEEYFNNLFSVLKTSINSLLKTTNKSQTNITIINNDSKKEVTDYIDDLLISKKIDKHVKLGTNYGKVYTVLSEAKASYEDFITIADADVFYFSNWLHRTIDIFKNYKKAGVVAPLPMPQLSYYSNYSLFFDNLLKIKKGKVVLDEDLLLFEKSINNQISLKKNNWFKNQLYLSRNNVKVCIGAGHFVATYRKDVLHKIKINKTKFVFEDGAETFYLDNPIDKLGYYRLSTLKTFAYHLGNNIPNWVNNFEFSALEITNYNFVNKFKKPVINYKFKEFTGRIYRKLKIF